MKIWEKLTTSRWAAPVGLVVIGLVGFQLWRTWHASDPASMANDRIFVCSETGKSFHVTLTEGMNFPVHSPFSGKDTGWPAEMCYWTADGQIKKEPTPVILNKYLGAQGPTFCPDCGRLVVGHNPVPNPNSKPPLTKAEYEARHSAGSGDR